MTVFVCEDDDFKYEKIKMALTCRDVPPHNIRRIRALSEFTSLASETIELGIIDIMMPSVSGGQARDVGVELLEMISGFGRPKFPVLAISAFANDVKAQAERYAAHGCIIYDFNAEALWGKALDMYVAQARDQGRYGFIVFTALQEERDAYGGMEGLDIKSTVRYGIDHWDVVYNGVPGTIVLLPKMGLVMATATVAKVLERYTPRVVAMSGMCAGIGKDVHLGQMLIADICWEYQSGKWLEDAFVAEPYQVSIPQETRAQISKMLEGSGTLREIEARYLGKVRASRRSEPRLVPFATGSAVIASEKRLEAVKVQHRKVSGLDMETFGVYQAINMSGLRVHFFACKTVVDKADAAKGDDLHEYGCFVSASMTIQLATTLHGIAAFRTN